MVRSLPTQNHAKMQVGDSLRPTPLLWLLRKAEEEEEEEEEKKERCRRDLRLSRLL